MHENIENSFTLLRGEEIKYVHRFEEGYDLHDLRYQAWLEIHHSDTISVSSYKTPTITSNVYISSSSVEFSSTFSQATSSHSTSTVMNPSESSPSLVSHSMPNRVYRSQPNSINLTPTFNSVSDSTNSSTGDTVKCSPLSELINLPNIEKSKTVKTGSAQVLTSNECLKAFQEKEEKKRLAAEENQKKRKKRKEKKQKEEEVRHNEEVKAQKAAMQEAKQHEKGAIQRIKQQEKMLNKKKRKIKKRNQLRENQTI